MKEAIETLATFELFKGRDPSQFSIERLGGLTNKNFKVVDGENKYVLRIPGEGTEEYIDRKAEEAAARISADVGVNAEVLHFDTSSGVQLTRFIEGAITMNEEGFKQPGTAGRAALALRDVHRSGKKFTSEFNIFSMMDEYLGILRGKNAWVPDGYEKVQEEADSVRHALAANPLETVPCHCDPLAENFLDTGERMYVVDWEYAGNNDPMWDLGDLSVEADFGADQDQELLEAYCDGNPSPENIARMVLYKAMCDLLWPLWGALQLANDNPAEDFKAYANERFERCRSLMSSKDFSMHLSVGGKAGA